MRAAAQGPPTACCLTFNYEGSKSLLVNEMLGAQNPFFFSWSNAHHTYSNKCITIFKVFYFFIILYITGSNYLGDGTWQGEENWGLRSILQGGGGWGGEWKGCEHRG